MIRGAFWDLKHDGSDGHFMSDGKQYFTAIHDIHILADNDSIL
jgi:hypothetical protein